MDQTDVTTPNPCILSPEEQNVLRAILRKFNTRTGTSFLPFGKFVNTYFSTSNNNKGNRLDIDPGGRADAGLKVYDGNGVLQFQLVIADPINAGQVLLTSLFGITGSINLWSNDLTSHWIVQSGGVILSLNPGGTVFQIDTQVRHNITTFLKKLIGTYNNIATTGWGVPAIYGTGRVTAQAAAVASIAAYTVGTSDGSFLVSANINITVSTTFSFTCTVTYTDETNTPRTLTLTFSQITGVLLTTITNVQGTGAYEGIPLHIRCKASTTITIGTIGTFTSVTYNAEGYITQIG